MIIYSSYTSFRKIAVNTIELSFKISGQNRPPLKTCLKQHKKSMLSLIWLHTGSIVQLLMINQVILVMKVNRNAKKRLPKSLKNEMLIFGLCSTSDDPLSDLREESQLECKTMPPKSSKNEMLIFGLCSTSHDSPSDLSEESQLKCKKGPLSHWKMQCSFLDYIPLLMIGWVIQAMEVDWNVKKGP